MAGCTTTNSRANDLTPRYQQLQRRALAQAREWLGKHERTHRRELRNYMGVDPVHVEWCAAFLNRVLEDVGLPGTDSLMARSFLWWGRPVTVPEVRKGDLVVYRRGTNVANGHVGIYAGSTRVKGQDYWIVVAGNQNNSVSEKLYPARTRDLLSIRRWDSSSVS